MSEPALSLYKDHLEGIREEVIGLHQFSYI